MENQEEIQKFRYKTWDFILQRQHKPEEFIPNSNFWDFVEKLHILYQERKGEKSLVLECKYKDDNITYKGEINSRIVFVTLILHGEDYWEFASFL